jgi:D-arabinose 1-dehydrogenase-like Zn-dependent alcohol dehydrogenase
MSAVAKFKVIMQFRAKPLRPRRFAGLENIRPMIETVPLEQAADAYARMMQGKARFRMVLVTGQ